MSRHLLSTTKIKPWTFTHCGLDWKRVSVTAAVRWQTAKMVILWTRDSAQLRKAFDLPSWSLRYWYVEAYRHKRRPTLLTHWPEPSGTAQQHTATSILAITTSMMKDMMCMSCRIYIIFYRGLQSHTLYPFIYSVRPNNEYWVPPKQVSFKYWSR